MAVEAGRARGAEAGERVPHRSGVVAILGLPNAGKSTLLNRLLGEKLAIVTPRPQTTRSRILGILTRPGAQILFYDTPGLHRPRGVLGRALNEQVVEAAADCDVALLLVDLGRGFEPAHAALLAALERGRGALIAVGTKLDLPGARECPWPPPGLPRGTPALRISAHTGEGVEDLLEAVIARLPEGPPYYDDAEITDRPVRFLVAELVREAAFELLGEEIPYRVAVRIAEFDESDPERIRIRAEILVERESQKRIVIGRGGRMIREIGIRARREIEGLLGSRVHLELWVKVAPRWARSPRSLRALGYF